MESFGLFNFLKSAFFPSPSAESGTGNSPVDAASFLKNIFPSPQAEKKSEPNAENDVAQPSTPASSADTVPPPQANAENNPFLALMERHERLAKNIERKTPRR